MIDLLETLARLLFDKFGAVAHRWDELSNAERDIYFGAAQDVLTQIASTAPVDTQSLVDKMRETRPSCLGFLYMTYSLNRTEAAALLAFRMAQARARTAA